MDPFFAQTLVVRRVADFQGAPEAEALAAESERLLQEIEPVLARVLELSPRPGATVSQLDSVPVLTLRLYREQFQRQLADADYSQMLNTFAILAKYSQRLNAFPKLKSEFWLDVLESSMMFESTHKILQTSFKNPAFPCFVIDLHRHEQVPEQVQVLCEALYTLMTTPSSTRTRVQQAPPGANGVVPPERPMVALGLSFAGNWRTSVSIETIERLLDRVFAHPDRQYALAMLESSDNIMNAAELAVVARIAQKSKCVYQVEELKLDKIILGLVSSSSRCPNETPHELLDIVRAVFDVDKLPALTNNNSPSGLPARQVGAQPSRLRKISLNGNYLFKTYFATFGSALRYGCPLEENMSGYIAKRHEEKANCWR